MKKRNSGPILLLLSIALLSFQLSSAQTLDNSLLWKIEGKGIQTSYLFGTFHMLSKKDYEMKQKVVESFNQTSQLALELKMDNPLLQLEMLRYTGMKDSMTIDRLIDSVEYRKLDKALKESVGMGIAMFNTYKPMIIGTFLIMKYMEGEPVSLDMKLSSMAKAREIPVIGLETIAYQMRLFDEIPYEDQVVDLMEMVNEEARMQNLFARMITTYKKEDINALYKLTIEDAGSEKELELLLFKRNREWIAKIEKFSKEKPTFYGVGAAHLGGSKGLIILLRNAGYKVTPIF